MGRSDSAARAWQALFAGCCFGWLAAGCATVHAPAGDHPGPMATPSTGSATGWISGDVAKRVRRSAAISAGISALSAGSVSYYMDVQEAKLRQVLQGSGVGVIRSGNEITLNLPEAPSFAADSADLTPSFAGILDSLSAVLKKYDKTVIEVAGHTDSSGPHAQNQSLTERRAAVVAAFLESHGVIKARLATIGAAETRPVASNGTPQGRASNRRMELTLSPLTQGS